MTTPSETIGSFSRWRNILWPVHRSELKKLVPMLIIFFLLSFDYNVLRIMKDTLVVTAKSSGAEVIPFIKVWVMFPSALLLTFLFTRFSNRFDQEKVFYIILSLFLGYFLLFGLVLYPLKDWLHPNGVADYLETIFPIGLRGLIAMFRNWTFTTFYVMSELWSNIILSLLFWGFANQVTLLKEAKRFYGLFGIGANFSGVAAGEVSIWLSRPLFNQFLPFAKDSWEQSMFLLLTLVLISGIISIALFRWLHTSVLAVQTPPTLSSTKKTEKQKLSVREGFKFLLQSPYMLCMATIVIAYNLVINLVEVVWKHEVHELFPNPADYNLYMSQVTTIIGVIATLTSMLISGNSLRKFGWTFTAMITPAILFITSIGFFSFFFMKGEMSTIVMQLFGASPLAIVVFFGSAQNVLSRAAKYTVFDTTKEMAFVPLSSEDQLKGKSAIDGICSRLGKSSGSVIHQALLISLSTITASAPYVACFLLATILLWMGAVRLLGKKFYELSSSDSPSISPQEPIVNTRPIMQGS